MKNRGYRAHNITLTKQGKAISYHRRSLIWLGTAVLMLILSDVMPTQFFEQIYYKGIFRVIRTIYDTLFGWSPVPMIYFVVLIVLVRIVKWFNDWKRGFFFQFSRALGGVGMLITLFYVLWGFNYNQVALQDRLELNLESVTQEDVEMEFQRATEILRNEAENLPDQYTSDAAIAHLKVSDDDLRADVERALDILQLSNKGHVRVRQLWPKGFLLRWSTAGIYIPHAVEGHIDMGLMSVQKPFTLAHEMAHGYGVTDEGACNFIAWLACSQSKDAWVRYGGAFTYWRYAAAEMEHSRVEEVIHTLDPVVMRSIILVRENDQKYPDIMPQIRDAIYSSYLKQHGVKGGLRSYNYVVKMVSQYLKREGSNNN